MKKIYICDLEKIIMAWESGTLDPSIQTVPYATKTFFGFLPSNKR